MGVCHCLWFHAETNKQIFFFFNLGVDNHLLADSPRFPPPALLVFSAVLSSTRRGSHLKVVSQGPHRVKSCGAFERSWTDVKRKDGRRMEQMEAKQMLHWNQRKTIYIYILYIIPWAPTTYLLKLLGLIVFGFNHLLRIWLEH